MSSISTSITALLLIAHGVPRVAAQILVVPPEVISQQFPGRPHELAYDAARELIYVSIPLANEIVVMSSRDFSIVDTIVVSPSPTGIDLSIDGDELFVALDGGGAVAVVDLAVRQVVETIFCSTQLGTTRAWDVVEARPDWLFVSGNVGSGGFSYIALIRRDLNNFRDRVASERIIRAAPRFIADPLQQALYIGEGFSPNSLYKLDITQSIAPIILEDVHGTVAGSQRARISPDGARIALTGGGLVDTATLNVIGSTPLGLAQFNADGTRLWRLNEVDEITAFDTPTQALIGSEVLPCPTNSFPLAAIDFFIDPTESYAFRLFDNGMCGITTLVAPVFGTATPHRARFDAGPVSITVSGNFFDLGATPRVFVGAVEATDVQVVDRTTLTCIVPSDAAGPKRVRIVNELGEDEVEEAFHRTPSTLQSIGPAIGGLELTYSTLMSQSDAVGLLLSLGDPVAVQLPGITGPLCLPMPNEMIVLPSWPFDEFRISLPIPNEPTLSGLRVLGQILTATPSSGSTPIMALGNCTSIVLP